MPNGKSNTNLISTEVSKWMNIAKKYFHNGISILQCLSLRHYQLILTYRVFNIFIFLTASLVIIDSFEIFFLKERGLYICIKINKF